MGIRKVIRFFRSEERGVCAVKDESARVCDML